MRPRLLDLYCAQGGAAEGYRRAGFDVTGVDLAPQPRYPFRFAQGDALAHLAAHGHEYDAVHASPPCQDHSSLSSRYAAHGTGWLLHATWEALSALGRPYVVENVPGAPLPGALVLCGTHFGLGARCRDGRYRQLRRHRLFASNVPLVPPGPCRHRGQALGVYGHGGNGGAAGGGPTANGYKGFKDEGAAAMGIGWMTGEGLSQALPPAYTEYLGQFLALAVGALAA